MTPVPRWLQALLALWGVLILYVMYRSLWGGALTNDLGYYLSAAEHLADGGVPNLDFQLLYTPLGLYAFSMLRTAFGGHPAYSSYVALLNVFNLLFAGTMYFTLCQVTKAPILRVVGMMLALSQLVYLDGTTVQLETFTIIFTTLATGLAIGAEGRLRWWAFSGVAVALAFFSKQYGVLAAPPLAVFALTSEGTWRARGARCAVFCAAGATTGIAYVAYFMGRYGMTVVEVTKPMFTSGYAKYAAVSAISALIVSYVLKTTPVLVLSPLAVMMKPRSVRIPLLAVSLMAFFALALLVRQYLHYLLLLVPFGVILLVSAADHFVERRGFARPVVFALSVSAALLVVHLGRLSTRLQPADRVPLDLIAQGISPHLTPKSRVVLLAHPALMFLTHATPVMLREHGYQFMSFYTEVELQRSFATADVAIIDPSFVSSLPGGLSTELASVLVADGLNRCSDLPEGIGLWQRTPCD